MPVWKTRYAAWRLKPYKRRTLKGPVRLLSRPFGVCVIAKSEGVERVPQVRQGVPGPNKTGDPDFLHMAPNRSACAAFIKESRMKSANANKLHRKSGKAHQSF